MVNRRAIARGLAGLLGGLLLLDVVRQAVGLSDIWWLDLRSLRPGIAQVARIVVGGLVVSYAGWPRSSPPRRIFTIVAASLVALVALRDGVIVVTLAERGVIGGALRPPLSIATALIAAVVAIDVYLGPPVANGRCERLLAVGSAGGTLVALTLGQMICFGATDYRRSADAVVVLGARTYADGRPSLALYDRVRTGCELVLTGRADRLILSGGPGDGAVHETSAMHRIALDHGVPPEAIVLDTAGIDTGRTARSARSLLPLGARVLAVSHDYHLPRVKLSFAREGLEAFTVPANETRTLARLPYYMLREVAAFWAYYLGDLGAARG